MSNPDAELVEERDELEELNDYVDGRLDPQRRAEVAARIAADPELARRVAAYVAQNEALRALTAETLAEPIPDRLRRLVARPRRVAARQRMLGRAAAALALLLLGGAGGWLLRDGRSDSANLLQPFVQQAILAHRLAETETPAEADRIPKTDGDVLPVSSFGLPFDAPVRAPSLRSLSYSPVAFRSLSGTSAPAGQFVYRDADGRQLTLFIRQHSGASDIPFRYDEEQGYRVLHWLDGPLVYVLVGHVDKNGLAEVARAVYGAPALPGRTPVQDIQQVTQ